MWWVFLIFLVLIGSITLFHVALLWGFMEARKNKDYFSEKMMKEMLPEMEKILKTYKKKVKEEKEKDPSYQ